MYNMNVIYTKPSTRRDVIRFEAAFMQCSVRVSNDMIVQDYFDEVGSETNPFDVSNTWSTKW